MYKFLLKIDSIEDLSMNGGEHGGKTITKIIIIRRKKNEEKHVQVHKTNTLDGYYIMVMKTNKENKKIKSLLSSGSDFSAGSNS